MGDRVVRVLVSLALPLWCLVPAGCGRGGTKPAPAASAQPASGAAAQRAATAFVPLDACSLLEKAEVEGIVGQPVMEPVSDRMANLSTCSFGVPGSPMAGTRPINVALTLTVFTGEEAAYYKGAAAQARDGYEMTRKNAGSDEALAGLGESAYWDKGMRSLSAIEGKYWITASVDAGLEPARKAVAKALERLP